MVEIEIVNEYVHGNIKLTKVDAEYPDNKLTGATFEVYKDTNENGKIDKEDELIGNLEETETGIYEMKELLYGHYMEDFDYPGIRMMLEAKLERTRQSIKIVSVSTPTRPPKRKLPGSLIFQASREL